jgi:hypothetical protein
MSGQQANVEAMTARIELLQDLKARSPYPVSDDSLDAAVARIVATRQQLQDLMLRDLARILRPLVLLRVGGLLMNIDARLLAGGQSSSQLAGRRITPRGQIEQIEQKTPGPAEGEIQSQNPPG